jgi:hypothetical protein
LDERTGRDALRNSCRWVVFEIIIGKWALETSRISEYIGFEKYRALENVYPKDGAEYCLTVLASVFGYAYVGPDQSK